MEIHVTRVSGQDVYGHETSHCDPAGCNGTEGYYRSLRGAECAECGVAGTLVDTDAGEVVAGGEVVAEVVGERLMVGTRPGSGIGVPLCDDCAQQ